MDTLKQALFAYTLTTEQPYLHSPAAKSGLLAETADQKTQYKMIGAYLPGFAYNKTSLLANFINYRFVKELIKVFFTLLLEKRFVDIAKCV